MNPVGVVARLTFHEAKISVTSYVNGLVQKGALTLVLDNQEGGGPA